MTVTAQQVLAAYERARDDLLAEQTPGGPWTGRLASSALATATAVSALSVVATQSAQPVAGLDQLIQRGIRWLVCQQRSDGGWGDTDKSLSNIATTMLAVAALRLAGQDDGHPAVIERAERYIQQQKGIQGLRRRYGKDKTFAVPILTNAALAGMVDWSAVSPLPFEAACVPQRWYRFLQLPVVSYAIPALVAIGQARFFHLPPRIPLVRQLRQWAVPRSLRVLERMQPDSGGYLEAVPLTSFVVMALASTGRADHPAARRGLYFLLATARADGSWPIDTNLATWNTTLALNGLATAREPIEQYGCLEWLLDCQHHRVHPFTGARPGGWGWSDLSGAVPDADDTAGALLALAHFARRRAVGGEQRARLLEAAQLGVRWLLDLQNRDGGWPTFCRGWGRLPFDRSGTDLTAHVLRALAAWRRIWTGQEGSEGKLLEQIERATARGLQFLQVSQRPDGSWVPLWFGNQHNPREENPVYGTARVLMAYRDLRQIATPAACRGLKWLSARQHHDGGWGGGPLDGHCGGPAAGQSTVEETALAAQALLAAAPLGTSSSTINRALEWLCCKVESAQHREPSPIGFYFAKLWYYEKLYPLIFTVAALGQAIRQFDLRPGRSPPDHA